MNFQGIYLSKSDYSKADTYYSDTPEGKIENKNVSIKGQPTSFMYCDSESDLRDIEGNTGIIKIPKTGISEAPYFDEIQPEGFTEEIINLAKKF
ncbi:hypothetical protein BB558_006258 [Smittium angustum]|uniref:Uncharacterized protein n=1 Tax=Smittium angustum TaxID=133377 RepID=A0A2U1IY82_SMIAN|nr:hypothetical protein BB558_006258 [Smittium angustum]